MKLIKSRSVTKIIVLLAILMSSVVSNNLVSAADLTFTPYTSKEDAINKYLEVTPMRPMVEDVLKKLAAALPVKQQSDFIIRLGKEIKYPVLEVAVRNAVEKTYTLKELNTLLAFLSSPDGRSILAKQGLVQQSIGPMFQKEIMRAYEKVNAEDNTQPALNTSNAK